MNKFIPLSVPSFQGNEAKYVNEAIVTEWVSTGGKFINQFENNIAKYIGASNAVACQSGTAGLHIACILAGVLPQDEVIAPTLTFIAAINPIRYCGAEPVFMDCDEDLCLDADKLGCFLERECTFDGNIVTNKLSHKIIKAVIYVHVFGNTGNFEKVVELCSRYKLKLIEDATESLGTYFTDGKLKGQFTGTIGDYGVYSFNGNKIITTGGGGMLICKSGQDSTRAKYLTTQAKDDEIRFIHGEVGYNYRMTNLQAALGIAQLENLEKYIQIRTTNYTLYRDNGINLLPFNKNIRPNYWFYSFLVEPKATKTNLDLMGFLDANKVQTRPIWYLNHLQKPYLECQHYRIDKAFYYFSRILNLPCSANLSSDDVNYISRLIVGEDYA
jgi:perosamine synthetase